MKFSKEDTAGLKGIAILVMMLHHCFCEVSRFEAYDISFYPFTQSQMVSISLALKVCVGMFAFISGYGLWLSYRNRKESAGRWVYRRYIRTFGGYWFVFLAAMVITFLINRMPIQMYIAGRGWSRGLIHAFINFIGLHGLLGTVNYIGTWWYMTLALCIIILVPFVYEVAGKVGIGLTWLASMLLPLILQIGYPGGTASITFLPVAIMGMFMAELSAEGWDLLQIGTKSISKKVVTAVFSILAVIAYFFSYDRMDTEHFWVIKMDLMPIIIIFVSLRYVTCIPGLRKVLAFLGKYSMNVFLIHSFIRYTYCSDLVYGFHYWWLIPIMLLILTLPLAILTEVLKKVTRWNRFCTWLENLWFTEPILNKVLQEKHHD